MKTDGGETLQFQYRKENLKCSIQVKICMKRRNADNEEYSYLGEEQLNA